MRGHRWPLPAILVLICGCAHSQLRNHTVRQVSTAVDMQHQQVLDNLAMFVVNPEAMPYFSTPGAGSTSLDTTAQAGNTVTWNAFGFLQDAFNINASRRAGGSWTLATVNDPAKLIRMRCAYQIAVGYYPGDDVLDCEQCCALINRWYGEPFGPCGVPCHIPRPGWFCTGGKRDVPKDARYVGRHCDTYVWVFPGGVEELTRLTLTILDFATAASGYAGPSGPSQEVVRRWTPIYSGEEVTGYRLAEVVTTTIEPKTEGGLPAGRPRIGETPKETVLPAERVLRGTQFDFDRPRENLFNPILPQLELLRN